MPGGQKYKIITCGVAGTETDWVAVMWQLEAHAPNALQDDVVRASEYLESEFNRGKKAKKRPEGYADVAGTIFEGLLSVLEQPSSPRRH